MIADLSPMMTASPAIPKADPLQEARDHILNAMRSAHNLNVTLNCYACDDDFGQPNEATAIVAELTFALETLAEMGR